MAIVIDTIKPDGTGDYVTLEAWWADTRSDEDAHWAECYAGGDIGSVILTDEDWAGTVGESNYWKIYTPLSERHTGQLGTGAYFEGRISSNIPYTTVDGLRGENAIAANASVVMYGDYGIVRNCLINYQYAYLGSSGILLYAGTLPQSKTMYAYNNIVHMNSGEPDNVDVGIIVNANAFLGGVVELTAYVYNNTVVGDFVHGIMRMESIAAKGTGTPICNLIAENNISCNSMEGDYEIDTIYNNGSLSLNNNLSSDGTSDDWGGSGHLINKLAVNQFIDPVSDFNLIETADAVNTGIAQTIFNYDYMDKTRPIAYYWDMGAFEFGSLFKEQLSYKTDITRDVNYKTNVTQTKGFKSDITKDIDYESSLITAKAYKSNITQEINYKSKLNG